MMPCTGKSWGARPKPRDGQNLLRYNAGGRNGTPMDSLEETTYVDERDACACGSVCRRFPYLFHPNLRRGRFHEDEDVGPICGGLSTSRASFER